MNFIEKLTQDFNVRADRDYYRKAMDLRRQYAGTVMDAVFLARRANPFRGLFKRTIGWAGILWNLPMAAGAFIAGSPLAGVFFLVCAGGFIKVAQLGYAQKDLVRRYYQYGAIIGTAPYYRIDTLAEETGRDKGQVLDDLKDMQDQGMLPPIRFADHESLIFFDRSAYNEYMTQHRDDPGAGPASQRKPDMSPGNDRGIKEEALHRTYASAYSAGTSRREAPKATGRKRNASAKPKWEIDLSGLPKDSEAYQVIKTGQEYIAAVHQANVDIPGEVMSAKLDVLEDTLTRIFTQVAKDPDKAGDLRKMLDYYLPTIRKLLTTYVELDRQPADLENVRETKLKIEGAVDSANTAFSNFLDGMFRNTAWDVSSDIAAMNMMLAHDGLTGEPIRKD